MRSTTLAAGLIAALTAPAAAYIRFDCMDNIVEERADPVVNPGTASGHVHKIVGGNGFDLTMDYDKARSSSCSSCPIKQDLSNYWTPKLYYKKKDGGFISVPMGAEKVDSPHGGMVVYYQQRGPNTKNLKAFPKNFRMLAGDPSLREFKGGFAAEAVRYACLDAGHDETTNLPNYNCPNGLRAQVYFPSCWDGKNLDSPDHRSHMSYPASGSFDNGPCPASHPVQLVSLFYEVLYNTNMFKDQWYDGKQPFVFSNGDDTGYSFHGDFVNGWDIDTLQTIVNTCTNDAKFGSIESDACPVIQKFSDDEMRSCKVQKHFPNEIVVGTIAALPGGGGDFGAVATSAGAALSSVVNVAASSTAVSAAAATTSAAAGVSSASASSYSYPSTMVSLTTTVPAASAQASSAVSSASSAAAAASTSPTGSTGSSLTPATGGSTVAGFKYVGCALDAYSSGRTIDEKTTVYSAGVGEKMTVQYCADFCKGYKYFGLEYYDQCFCGSSVASDRMPTAATASQCSFKCKGDSSQTCGGSWALSLYEATSSSSKNKRAGFAARRNAFALDAQN